MRKLTHQELVAGQEDLSRRPRLPFMVILNDIRSLYNVGAIIRTADGAGVVKLWLCGITGSPPQSQIHKTALGAEDRVAWEYHRDAVFIARMLKSQGYRLVVLEQTDQSQDYAFYQPVTPLCLVVGNEITGVDERLVEIADQAISIPMDGLKNSLNVSVAFGIVAYHLRHGLIQNSVPSLG